MRISCSEFSRSCLEWSLEVTRRQKNSGENTWIPIQNMDTANAPETCLSIIATIEPAIIKTILATDFDSYSLGDSRKKMMIPFLGQGILTTDGPAWQRSRDILRPNFSRTQISGDNMAMFERNVQNVIRAIPRDGLTTVDLHDLFFSMSLDIATEFLFGEGVGLLKEGTEKTDGKADEFVKAFGYAHNTLEGATEGGWGLLALFLPDKKLRRAHVTVHGKCSMGVLVIHVFPLELNLA